MAGC
ncbi:hypothetical protein LSH36_10g06031 [Paralvinella palmiformis]|jgi:hypothetical protein